MQTATVVTRNGLIFQYWTSSRAYGVAQCQPSFIFENHEPTNELSLPAFALPPSLPFSPLLASFFPLPPSQAEGGSPAHSRARAHSHAFSALIAARVLAPNPTSQLHVLDK